ncbi:uncharacterized protein VTP21DRAFT_2259 [Calcarisporiella thermophila]|uniref:uncharacterized protein n=1 Tax=Calcarisporiella thermophila TaxID=911321 RepID=UPI0037445C40
MALETVNTCLAASWTKPGRIEVTEKKLRPLRPGEILIQIEASGLCGTDLHICKGETPHARLNSTIGHEFAGKVVAIHPETATNIPLNARVAIDPNLPCHACTFCRNARPHLCTTPTALGVTQDGGMAEYAIVPITATYLVPDHLPPEAACLAEPLSCVVHAVEVSNLRVGDEVLIFGCGPIGIMTIALCISSGARVTVVEPNADRRQLAMHSFGAAASFDPSDLSSLSMQFDVVFECVGRTNTMEASVDCAKPGGTIVWVGVAKPDAKVSLSPFNVYRRELTIKSTYTNPHAMERAIRILANGTLRWDQIVTHSFPLKDFEHAWDTFLTGKGLKVCIKP